MYMFVSHEQNAGHSHNITISNTSSETAGQPEHSGSTLTTYQNSIREEQFERMERLHRSAQNLSAFHSAIQKLRRLRYTAL